MTLLLIFILTLVVTFWFFMRDREFAKKDLKDVIQNEDLKQFLNMPSPHDKFAKDLQISQTHAKPSRQLLDELNSKK